MIRFALLGAGFRAQTIVAVAAGMDNLECVGVVSSRPHRSIPGYPTLDELCAETEPDFVIATVASAAMEQTIIDCVQRGLRVLAETPPATSREGLWRVWAAAGESDMVQVAEQYPCMPMHAARIAAVRNGAIGQVTQVQVSSTQLYHAVALMRAYLHVGTSEAVVRAVSMQAPLLQPLNRAGWTGAVDPVPATTTIGVVDFGQHGSGVYDFTDNQTRNLLRHRRLVVRGSHGEISDLNVVRSIGADVITTSEFRRWQTGQDVDLNGLRSELISLDGEVLWRNLWPQQRWNDDELAVATILNSVIAWIRREAPGPYSLGQACTDQSLALAFAEAAALDAAVTVPTGPWSAPE